MPKKAMLLMKRMRRGRKITKVPKEPLLLEAQIKIHVIKKAQLPIHVIKRVRGIHLQGNLTRFTSYMP